MARAITIKASTARWAFGAVCLTRMALGFVFLWAFVDKLFGLGFATCRSATTNAVNMGCSQAWLHGGSPTAGFLDHATKGPFAATFQSLSGMGWVDWLFMAGLLGIGLGLLLGILVRISAVSGIVLLMLMWLSSLWPANNPFVDEHITQSLMLVVIALFARYDVGLLAKWWRDMPMVRKCRWFI